MMPELYFNDPRFRLTLAGRIFARIAAVTAEIVFTACAFLFAAQSVVWLRWFGVFLLLVLADRFLHRQEGDAPISELLRHKRINVAQAMAPGLVKIIERALEGSGVTRTDLSLVLTRELLREKEIRTGITRLDLEPKELLAKTDEFLKREEARSALTKEEKLEVLKSALLAAFGAAAQNGHRFIQPTDLFAVLPQVGKGLTARLFTAFDVDPGDLERALIFGEARAHRGLFGAMPAELSGIILPAHRGARHRVMNRAWTSRPTPLLDQFGTDYTDAAREQSAGFLIGHDADYGHMVTALARESNPNVILVGEEGAGKESLVGHLAFQIEKDEVPPALFDRRLVSLDVARLVAGGSPEELQSRLQKIVAEINLAGNIILFIPDIHNLVKTGNAGYISAADALLPVIRNNNFPILGTTFPREYHNLIEPRSDFAGMFEAVEVKEISPEEAERVLVFQAMILEARFKITITFGAVKNAVNLAHKYFRNLLLPASAIELLKSAVTESQSRGEKIVNHESVIRAAETRFNVPLHETTKAEDEKLLNLENIIHERLVDQAEAVGAVADALRQYRSGVGRQGGPIASFLFVGPTGVGKTELAKILADVQFGSVNAMMRFDMTEYKDKESIRRFIGSPDGNISGALTEAVKKQPYGLILLDEFEKASPDILDLFLQVLDDGRLTDAEGHTESFENTIIIATSNAHSDIVNDALRRGESAASIADYLKSQLTDVFKPELLNRFSRIVIFHDLRMEDMVKISALELGKAAAALYDKGITLTFDQGVVDQMAKWGYDPAFGARPLRRAVDEHLRAPLAEWLLKEHPPRGAEVRATLSGETLTFTAGSQN